MPIRRPFAVALAAVVATFPAAAQRQPLPPPGAIDGVAGEPSEGYVDELDGLLRLPGAEVELLYPPDHLDRAARLQQRLTALVGAWQPLTRRRLSWRVAIVGPTRWRQLAPATPWGWPVRLAGPLFVVPAQGDAGTVTLASALVGGALPDPGGAALSGTSDEAASILVIDLLTQLEAARELADTAGWKGDEAWIRELAVHLALRYGWESREPSSVLERVQLFDRIAFAQGGAGAYRLTDFRPGLPRAVDLWFQAQFVRGADAIWVEKGRFGVKRLLDRWADGGRAKSRKELEKKYPGLLTWQQKAFAP